MKNLIEVMNGETKVQKGDAFFALAKEGNDVHVSYEGDKQTLVMSLLQLMKDFPDVEEIVCTAADAHMYQTED